MLNNIIIYIVATGLAFFGGHWITKNQSLQPYSYNAGGEETQQFGVTNFPTSLDTLTNPGATDSVATVSHSSQHSNANDAIEALEAKVGTGASTAVTNSIFVGNGAGTSLFSTYATGTSFYATNLTSTGLSTFGSFISNASSTIIGGLTIGGNSTTTNATTTNLAVTNLNQQIVYANAGGSFIPLSIGTGLILSGGELSNASVGGILSYFSSTTNTYVISPQIDVDANDVIMAWGLMEDDNCTADGVPVVEMRVKVLGSASTTIDTANNSNNTTVDCQQNLLGYFVATTTSTIYIDMAVTGGGLATPSGIFHKLLIQKLTQ